MKTAMQEDKETAIEWLIRMLYSPACVGFISGRRVIPHEIIKQALEKEKEQIINAAKSCNYIGGATDIEAEEYYNQTYNQNK
jgi:hypothetical protein